MISLSNDDFKKTVRLLRILASNKGGTLRERESGRLAALLIRKLERKLIRK